METASIEQRKRAYELALFYNARSRYWCLACGNGISFPKNHVKTSKHEEHVSKRLKILESFSIVGDTTEEKHLYRFLIPGVGERTTDSKGDNRNEVKSLPPTVIVSECNDELLNDFTQCALIQTSDNQQELGSSSSEDSEFSCDIKDCIWKRSKIQHTIDVCEEKQQSDNFIPDFADFELSPLDYSGFQQNNPVKANLSSLLRTLMIDDALPESTMKKLRLILVAISKNRKWLNDIPTLYEIKQVDTLIPQVRVMCATWKKGEVESVKITDTSKQEGKETEKNKTEKIYRIYFLNPIDILASMCTSSYCTSEWVYQSTSSSKYRFPSSCKQWKLLENEIKLENPNYTFATHAGDDKATAVMAFIGLFIDGFDHLDKTKENAYYLSVFSFGEQLYLEEELRIPLNFDPKDEIESWETLSHFLIPFICQLNTGVEMYFKPLKKKVHLFGKLLSCCGDDIGFRSLLGLKKPNCGFPSRFYNRHKLEFKDVIHFNPTTDQYDQYRCDHHYSKNRYVELYEIMVQANESGNKYHSLLEKVGRKTGINEQIIKKKGFPAFLHVFSDRSDFFCTMPPDELHIYRLGFLKQILSECNRKYDSPEYRALINEKTKGVSFIFKNESARKKDGSKVLNPKLNGNHMVNLFTGMSYYKTHETVVKQIFKLHESDPKAKSRIKIEEALQNEKELFCKAESFRIILQSTIDWDDKLLNQLQGHLCDLKTLFTKVFPNATCAQPNFENLDIIPYMIAQLGCPKFFGTQLFEKRHKQCKWAPMNSNKSNLQKYLWYPIARKASYRIAGCTFDLLIAQFQDDVTTTLSTDTHFERIQGIQCLLNWNTISHELPETSNVPALHKTDNRFAATNTENSQEKQFIGESHETITIPTLKKTTAMEFDHDCKISQFELPEKLLHSPNAIPKREKLTGDDYYWSIVGRPNVCLFERNEITPLLNWKEKKNIGCGLQNIGNTCFVNSVLQCLTYIPPLRNVLLSRVHSESCQYQGWCMICELEIHVNQVNENESFAPKMIISNLHKIGKQFQLGRQQDAHEFLRCLIGLMQQNCLKSPFIGTLTPVEQQTSLVYGIFGGILQSKVECASCKHKSITFDPILDLSLTVEPSLVQSLHQFCKEDNIKYSCDSCRILSDSTKKFTVFQPPNVLVLHFKRFSDDNKKMDDDVSFNEMLDIAPYLSERSENTSNSMTYHLCGVLVHYGAHVHCGHYDCYVYGSRNWYNMNDSKVSLVSLETVLKQKAYILFYVRIHNQFQEKQILLQKRKTREERQSPPNKRRQFTRTILQDCLLFKVCTDYSIWSVKPNYDNSWYDDNTECQDVENDGNCLFRAVSFSLWKTESYHAVLRQLAYQELIENENWYKNRDRKQLSSWWEEIETTANNKVWVGIPHFFALCNALRIVGVLYGRDDWTLSTTGVCFPFRTIHIPDYPDFGIRNVCAIGWQSLNGKDEHFISVFKKSHKFLTPFLREANDSLEPFKNLCHDLQIPIGELKTRRRGVAVHFSKVLE